MESMRAWRFEPVCIIICFVLLLLFVHLEVKVPEPETRTAMRFGVVVDMGEEENLEFIVRDRGCITLSNLSYSFYGGNCGRTDAVFLYRPPSCRARVLPRRTVHRCVRDWDV